MSISVKDRVLAALEEHKGSFVSGGALACDIGVSRNAVWKAIEALRNSGYEIESVTGRGYQLAARSSVLSAASITRYVTDPRIEVEYHDIVDSTNIRCKELAMNGAPEGTLVVASAQSAGRGRQGRSFFSPADSGVYFTLLLRPQFALDDSALVTSYAATVTSRAIEDVIGATPQIKWVNDIFFNGRKVCGILTEASFNAELARLDWMVVGIGIDVLEPEGGYPDDVASHMGALLSSSRDDSDVRARLVARVADLFMEGYGDIPMRTFLDEYRSHSMLIGKRVTVQLGETSFEALASGINDDCTLEVELDDGTTRALSYGEVHIPSSQFSSREPYAS